MNQGRRRIAALVFCLSLGCSQAVTSRHHEAQQVKELGSTMIYMQHYSRKLGIAIERRNRNLALFYVDELKETIDEIVRDYPEDNGDPIADIAKSMIIPQTQALGASITSGRDWKSIQRDYAAVIGGCNGCHSATAHAFIKITPKVTVPPYNQEF